MHPGSRDANRFFARLGFAPLAVRRVAPVAVVRRRLTGTDVRPLSEHLVRRRARARPAGWAAASSPAARAGRRGRRRLLPPARAPRVSAWPHPKTADAGARRSRLLLLDGHSLAYRAFFALPVENFSTTTGQPTNAVYGFTAMLINVLRDEQPTHLAVTFDVCKQTFRTEAYADYKAGRAETPNDFKGQVSLVREVLDALRVPIVTAEGFEADDVIATLATQAAADDMDVLIVTGDRDAFQLVSDRVTVLYNSRGVSDMRRMTPDAVQEKYGLSPEQYPEFAALRGDPSDNLPGIPGLGEKTATKLIQQYGDVALAHRPRRRGQGQGRRQPARRHRERRPQPAAHRAGPRRPARGRTARPAARAVGPRRGPQGLRRPAVPGAARAPLRHAVARRAGGRARLRGRGAGAEAGRAPGLPGRAAGRASGSGCTSAARSRGAPATSLGIGFAAQSAARGRAASARTTPPTSTSPS